MVSFKLWPLSLQEKILWSKLASRLDEPRTILDVVERKVPMAPAINQVHLIQLIN
jgi:hypothetical protein